MSLIIIADNIPPVSMACTLLVLSIVFSDQPHHINYFVQLYLLHKQRGDSPKNVLLTTVLSILVSIFRKIPHAFLEIKTNISVKTYYLSHCELE